MYRCSVILACLAPLMACSQDPPGIASEHARNMMAGEEPSSLENRDVVGQVAYETYCASCHDSGENGAPITGVAADWRDRSPQWQAVLFEHAKTGYLKMPARAGHTELSEAVVDAAAEYMLIITYPNMPKD